MHPKNLFKTTLSGPMLERAHRAGSVTPSLARPHEISFPAGSASGPLNPEGAGPEKRGPNLWGHLCLALAATALLNLSSFTVKAQTAPTSSSTPQPLVSPASTAPAVNPALASSAAATAADIHDIRGPRPVPSSDALVLELLLAALLALAACAVWSWYRFSRTTAKLPYELALECLERSRDLMKPELAREFSIEVSEIIRGYTEARFHVLATHRTTEEFLHDLLKPSDALLTNHRELLADFLQHCDLAKFARCTLTVAEMETMLQSARTYVTQTGKPVVAPPPAQLPKPAPAQTKPVPANA
jgi:hypothetical protein